MFVTSPDAAELHHANLVTEARGTFDDVSVHGGHSGAQWRGGQVGPTQSLSRVGRTGYFEPGQLPHPGSSSQAAGVFSVFGSGDIGPYVPPEDALGNSLVGMIVALIAVIAVATLFVTAEYRRGLIRTTLLASPRRGRVLAAKACVIGLVAFAAGLAGTAVAVPLGQRALRAHGVYLPPVTAVTEARVIAGTAAALAACAVLAVAVGTIARRGAAAVAAVTALIVAPYVLTVPVPVLPLGAADWLMRVTPAAAFAVEQTVTRYPQVDDVYAPAYGYFPLAPWAGLAVLLAWTAAALAVAYAVLARRDA